jgi:hypothetical protein
MGIAPASNTCSSPAKGRLAYTTHSASRKGAGLEKFFSERKTLLEAIETVVPPSLRKGKFRLPDKLLAC